MNKTIQYRINESIPVIAETDVLIIGGGPAGLGAAIAAAGMNMDTLLVERMGSPGGAAVHNEVMPFMPSFQRELRNGEVYSSFAMDRPVFYQWCEKMRSYLDEELRQKCNDPTLSSYESRLISPHYAALAAEDLLLANRVRVLYHHQCVDVIRCGDRIDYAVFASKSKFSAVKAGIIIDCTGDGDVAALAGCPFEYGDADHRCQPMTLCFKLDHVDVDAIPENLNQLYQQAREKGILNQPRENILKFACYEKNVIHFNTTRIIGKSALNGEELSQAEVEGRRQLRELWMWLRRSVPGFSRSQLRSMATFTGVRESRRISGQYTLTFPEIISCKKFENAIARCNYPVDIHNPAGSGTRIVALPLDDFFEIPYGCIVPQNIDNLLVGGRAISTSHEVNSSIRIMPTSISTGQAAGIAAAMAMIEKRPPRNLSGVAVRQALRQFGAWL